jgi:hypothetical protein
MQKPKMKPVLLFGLSVLLILGCFSPRVTPMVWHVRNGDRVDFHGKRITVPKDWYPDEILYYDISFSKPRLTVFSDRPPVIAASFSVIPGRNSGSREVIEQGLEASWRHDYAGVDYQTAPTKLFVMEADGFCMMHSPRKYPGLTWINCSLFASQWDASFMGASKEAEAFLSVIRSMSPVGR